MAVFFSKKQTKMSRNVDEFNSTVAKYFQRIGDSMIFQQPSIFRLTVQFEDVDANGVVHHPNYLKYLERARSYGIKEGGYSLEKLLVSGCALVVSEIHANYLRPALLEQELFVISRVSAVGKSLVKICQSITPSLPTTEEIEMAGERIFSLPETIFWAQISLVYVDLKSAQPKSIPQELKKAIKMGNQDLFAKNTQSVISKQLILQELQTV